LSHWCNISNIDVLQDLTHRGEMNWWLTMVGNHLKESFCCCRADSDSADDSSDVVCSDANKRRNHEIRSAWNDHDELPGNQTLSISVCACGCVRVCVCVCVKMRLVEQNFQFSSAAFITNDAFRDRWKICKTINKNEGGARSRYSGSPSVPQSRIQTCSPSRIQTCSPSRIQTCRSSWLCMTRTSWRTSSTWRWRSRDRTSAAEWRSCTASWVRPGLCGSEPRQEVVLTSCSRADVCVCI